MSDGDLAANVSHTASAIAKAAVDERLGIYQRFLDEAQKMRGSHQLADWVRALDFNARLTTELRTRKIALL